MINHNIGQAVVLFAELQKMRDFVNVVVAVAGPADFGIRRNGFYYVVCLFPRIVKPRLCRIVKFQPSSRILRAEPYRVVALIIRAINDFVRIILLRNLPCASFNFRQKIRSHKFFAVISAAFAHFLNFFVMVIPGRVAVLKINYDIIAVVKLF